MPRCPHVCPQASRRLLPGRRWRRCWDGSVRRGLMLHAGSEQAAPGRRRKTQAGPSTRHRARAWCRARDRPRPIVGPASFLRVWDFRNKEEGKAESEAESARDVLWAEAEARHDDRHSRGGSRHQFFKGQRRSADRRGGAPRDRGTLAGLGDEPRRRYGCATRHGTLWAPRRAMMRGTV
jgi:hypothetical protein